MIKKEAGRVLLEDVLKDSLLALMLISGQGSLPGCPDAIGHENR